MASLPFTHFVWVPRCHPTWSNCLSMNFFLLQGFRLQTKWPPTAVSRKNMAKSSDGEEPNGNDLVVKKRTTRSYKRVSSRTRKKATMDAPDDITELAVTNSNGTEEESIVSASSGDSKKTPRRTRRKAASASAGLEEDKTAKKVRRRRKTKDEERVEGQSSESDIRDQTRQAVIQGR